MPYSDRVPAVIYPDTDEGRFLAARDRRDGAAVGLCDKFKKDDFPLTNDVTRGLKVYCRNRSIMGDYEHNWCVRCMVGFPLITEESFDVRRIHIGH